MVELEYLQEEHVLDQRLVDIADALLPLGYVQIAVDRYRLRIGFDPLMLDFYIRPHEGDCWMQLHYGNNFHSRLFAKGETCTHLQIRYRVFLFLSKATSEKDTKTGFFWSFVEDFFPPFCYELSVSTYLWDELTYNLKRDWQQGVYANMMAAFSEKGEMVVRADLSETPETRLLDLSLSIFYDDDSEEQEISTMVAIAIKMDNGRVFEDKELLFRNYYKNRFVEDFFSQEVQQEYWTAIYSFLNKWSLKNFP